MRVFASIITQTRMFVNLSAFCFYAIAYYNYYISAHKIEVDMDINKKIMDMCNERNWSTYDLAKEAILTHSTLSSMLQRGTPPKIDTLEHICEAFGISLSQFFLDDEKIEVLSLKEKKLVSLFRKLSEQKQQALLNLIDK